MSETRYHIRGEVDLDAVPKLRTELGDAIDRGGHLLVDCTGLTFIDSSGIAALLEANRTLEANDRRMLIVNVSPRPRRVFELLGLTDLLRYDRETPRNGSCAR